VKVAYHHSCHIIRGLGISRSRGRYWGASRALRSFPL